MTVRLTIGYAFATYEKKFVKRIFDALLDGVEKVEEKLFTPNGRPRYKKFFITIHLNLPVLAFIDFIKENKFAAVVYNNEWDNKMHKYVDRYWKVFANEPRPVFRPYIMTQAQVRSDIFLVPDVANAVDPWSATADDAFGPETTPPPHPLFGLPCKLVRSEPKEFTELKELEEMDALEYADFCTPPPFYRSNT
jgi:hypothetical protein